ncbi:flagellar biosynthesis anti-sigma factor FlgM [Paucibacter sp. PLA-PC-4]|uniref:flagellar biosynthesis anti-sigma factor FlgM n=1 Tax=Paucibacter sp. PLA-PC-4 TaxID=2993655 RepID=UPI002249021D|nr:flagellar biosynthesis anti-sigma factor FlgM [Paucibacter sp. PLA-PC-4]MCX2861696.1 flagellar biosynthesis anti-sigma factor FlgM [Paucibacter sp. PLA-PC-4]
MRVTGQNGQAVDKLAEKSDIGKIREAAPAVLGAATAIDAALESSTLQPAKAVLAEMPEIDQAKVDMLREALARGEITFDAGRLAKLIQRFHGGRG